MASNTLPAPNHSQNLIGHRIDDGKLEFVSVLGLGAYGVVYLAKDVSKPGSGGVTGAKGGVRGGHYAVKCLNKVGMDGRQRSFQRREIALHGLASSHANIATLHNVIETPTCIYVVLAYYADGDLFGMITERGRYLANDDLIRSVFLQIIDAVEYCHSLGIYHRDLKPENILCSHDGHRVALADFGLATAEKTSGDFGCGSTFYMSPECQGGLFQRLGSYSTLHNDIWSLGVILVNLSCGRNPWKQACPTDETFRAYLGNPDFLRAILPISGPCNALLKRIFSLNPIQRISLAELKTEVMAMKRWTMTEAELRHATRATREAARAFAPAPPSPVASSIQSVGSWGEGVQASNEDVARFRAERWAKGDDASSIDSSSTSDFSYASSASNWSDFDPCPRARKSTRPSTPPRPALRPTSSPHVQQPKRQQVLPPTPPHTPRWRTASAVSSARPQTACDSDEDACFSASSSVSGASVYDDAVGPDAMVLDTPPRHRPVPLPMPALVATPPTPPTPTTPRFAAEQGTPTRAGRGRVTTPSPKSSPPAFGSSPSSSSSSGSSSSSSVWSAMPTTPDTPTFAPASAAHRQSCPSSAPSIIVVSPTPSHTSLAPTVSNASSKASYAAYYGRYAEWADESMAGGECDVGDESMDGGSRSPSCTTTPSQAAMAAAATAARAQSQLFSSRLAAHLAREQEKLRCAAAAQQPRVRAC